LLVISGCGAHYRLELAAAQPERLPPGMNVLESSACPSSQWRTSYEWRARAREPGKAVRVSSSCIEPAIAAQPGALRLDGDAKIELTGKAGGASVEPRTLEQFTFADKDGVVEIKDAGGRARTIVQVERIEYFPNAVIIRIVGGGGFIVDPRAVLAVRWNSSAPSK
jgi:hypothetical protein